MRALLAMRLEKNFGTWFREFRPIYGPFEADLGRFVKLGKNDFIGQEAARREFEDGPKRSRVSFVIDDLDADVMGDEPIWHENDVIGWITSGGYAHHIEKSLAQGYVPTELFGKNG
jgi:dimethylglycine dehydrogenase